MKDGSFLTYCACLLLEASLYDSTKVGALQGWWKKNKLPFLDMPGTVRFNYC